jgi:SAM-dependent methyltransferase
MTRRTARPIVVKTTSRFTLAFMPIADADRISVARIADPGERGPATTIARQDGTIRPLIPTQAMSAHNPEDLQRIYGSRFSPHIKYRREVWSVLVADWFGQYVRATDSVLDLGCGYGEFINSIPAVEKYAMDLNPDAPRFLGKGVRFLLQDCSARWELDDASLDVVFTSNFFEHLPDKTALGRALDEIHRCLRSGGRLVAMGPNIKHLPGQYWDFWDHHIPLTEASLKEALVVRGFAVDVCLGRFLPYTMATGPRYPTALLRAYLKLPLAWRFLGKQFLVVGTRR